MNTFFEQILEISEHANIFTQEENHGTKDNVR